MSYEVECLVRPLVELPSAYVSTLTAAAIGFMPNTFWLTASESWHSWGQTAVVSALLLNAARRTQQAYRMATYHSRLRVQPRYAVTTANIPHRKNGLFLGQAFRWDDRHTRRYLEANRGASKRFLKPSWFDRWHGLPIDTDDGGVAALHGVGSWEKGAQEDLWISDADRMGQVLVVGTTGCGKSRLLEILAAQDIRSGGPVIVLDPKGDKGVMLQMYQSAIACGREQDFICFHLAHPSFSARYNMFGSFARVTEIASRIRESLPDSGNSAAFAEFAWGYVNTIAMGLHKMGRKTTISTLLAHATNMDALVFDYMAHLLDPVVTDWRAGLEIEKQTIAEAQKKNPRSAGDRSIDTLASVVLAHRYHLVNGDIKTGKPGDDVGRALLKTFGNDRSHHDKLVASLFPLLQKMSSGAIGDLLSPDYDNVDDPRPILDFEAAIRQNKIIYIGLDALTDSVVAKAVGTSMFGDITSLAGRIYNYERGQGLDNSQSNREFFRIRIHADEFSDIIGNSFIPLLNKSRGAGFDVTAYTQSRADITVGFGDVSKGRQAEDNFNTLIMLRVQSEETAEMLTAQLPEIKVPTISWVSMASDGKAGLEFSASQGQKTTEEKTRLITPSMLRELPRGQAFVSTQGGRVFKTRFPLPEHGEAKTSIGQMAEKLIARRQSAGSEPWKQLPTPWHAKDAA